MTVLQLQTKERRKTSINTLHTCSNFAASTALKAVLNELKFWKVN